MGLLFDINASSQYQYSPNLSSVYSPTDARQISLQYTAPVFQIQSPNAIATSKKESNLAQSTYPTNTVSQPNTPVASTKGTDNTILYGIAGVVVIAAIFLFSKRIPSRGK